MSFTVSIKHGLRFSSMQPSVTMFMRQIREFVSTINSDALVHLGMRLCSIIFSITSIVLLCRAVTMQRYFLTDGLGLMYDMLPLGPVSAVLRTSSAITGHCVDTLLKTLVMASALYADTVDHSSRTHLPGRLCHWHYLAVNANIIPPLT